MNRGDHLSGADRTAVRTLLPLSVPPDSAPGEWRAVAVAAAAHRVTAVLAAPPADEAGPRFAAATADLADAGVCPLGHVDLAYGARPVADVLDAVVRWGALPVGGVFLDQAPTGPFGAGPVALAVRVARRAGLHTVVLNPGVPVEPMYRDLGATICSFDGSWADYQRWNGDGAEPGDGHLVHGVPPAHVVAARRLLTARSAGLGLLTDRGMPDPYSGLPSWHAATPALVGATG